MRLKFVPAAGMCVPHPGRGAGDHHFAGRVAKVEQVGDETVISHPTTEEPVEAEEGSKEAARFIQFVVRDGDMYPFDEATAKACGVPFVKVSRGADGEWTRDAAPKSIREPRKAAE